MPASPLDVEAQVDGGNGNRWFLETSYLACRVLELAFALWCFIAIVSITGADAKCNPTTAGPGSDICIPPYSFENFPSTVFMCVVSVISSIWGLFMFFAIVASKCADTECFTGECTELIQNFLDALCCGLNCGAFLWAATSLTSSQPDVNQGDSILDSMQPKDAQYMQMGIATSFLLFVLFAGSIGLNLKLYTKAQ